MRADDLYTWTRAENFLPFRIHLNSGRAFEIRHPETIKVGKTTALIFTYSGSPDAPHERVDMVSLVLMESVEVIESARSA